VLISYCSFGGRVDDRNEITGHHVTGSAEAGDG
jgi:hypothetical protein